MINQCRKMSKNFILFLCIFLMYTVNTESHQYVDIEDYPYHVRETHFFLTQWLAVCVPLTNKTIRHSHVVLIGSQYSAVTVSIQIAGRHVCSGAFIHESWIMTAASCVFRAKLSAVSVRVRSSYICTLCGNVLGVSNIVIHEKFDKYVYFNDIALIKLKSPAEFGEKLLPIGLPEKENEQVQDGTRCVVTGWKPELNPARPQLTAAAVAIINQRTCKERMPSYKPLSKEMLCAVNATRPSETCQGDLGAPLVSEQTLIGILSYGLGCETRTHPGLYTRISSYLSWIFVNSGIY